MKKRICMLMCFVLLVSALAGAASARSGRENIEISYRGISISLNGQPLTPCDSYGTPIEPFIYDGLTYLPVRGVAAALGLDVEWDAETDTIVLTSGGRASITGNAAKTHETVTREAVWRGIGITLDGAALDTGEAEPFIIDGTTYLPVRAIAEALGLEVGWDGASSTVILTTPGWTPPEPAAPEQPAAPSGTGTSGGGVTSGGTGSSGASGSSGSAEQSVTVYVTKTGKRYHYSSTCNGGTYIASTLAEAKARGLTPCKKCVG